MARRVVTTYFDDIDGTEIGHGKGGPVAFSLDGKTYSIDLTNKNAEKLRKALELYISVAKPAPRRTRKSAATSSASDGSPTAQELREWGRQNGFEVPARGRIPKEVRDAWTKR